MAVQVRLSLPNDLINQVISDLRENYPIMAEGSDLQSLQANRRCKSMSNIAVLSNSTGDALEIGLLSIISTELIVSTSANRLT